MTAGAAPEGFVVIAHPVSIMTGKPFADYSIFEVINGTVTGSVLDCFASREEAASAAAGEGWTLREPPETAHPGACLWPGFTIQLPVPAPQPRVAPPDRPPVAKGVCQVPRCPGPGPARLYPGGWLCDTHKPGEAVTRVPGWTPRSTS